MATNRFGIDRITLTNAGITDEEVTHLYKTLYVHSEGYLSTIKEICSKVKDIKLGEEDYTSGLYKHTSKDHIVSAIWKVF